MRKVEKERRAIKTIITDNKHLNCRDIVEIIKREIGKELTQSSIRSRAYRMGITLKAVEEKRNADIEPPLNPVAMMLARNTWNQELRV